MISLSGFRVARLATLATLVVGAVGIAFGSACVEDQDLLIIERAIWFSDRDTCVLTGSEPTPLAMTVDVAFDSPIGMGFLLSNEQVKNKQSNTGIDDTQIYIESAEVSLSFSGGAIEGGQYEVTVPNNSIFGGEEEPFLVEIPASVTESMRATMSGLPPGTLEYLEMEVVFKGRRTGQVGNAKLGAVKTAPYVYPFQICYECLGACVAAADCTNGVDTCPSPDSWLGVCGYAQGLSIVDPACMPPD